MIHTFVVVVVVPDKEGICRKRGVKGAFKKQRHQCRGTKEERKFQRTFKTLRRRMLSGLAFKTWIRFSDLPGDRQALVCSAGDDSIQSFLITDDRVVHTEIILCLTPVGMGDGGGSRLRDFARSPGSPCPQCHEPGAPEDLFSFSVGFALLCPKIFSCYLHLANICPLFMAALGRRLSRRLTTLAPSGKVNHHPLCITALSFARFRSSISHSDALMSRMLLPPP